MSTAVATPALEEPKKLTLVGTPAQPEAAGDESTIVDHPLVPVFIAMVIAAVGAIAFVGSIIAWLLVRDTGVGAP